MTTVVLAFGANLGDRLANLRSAVAMLEDAGLTVTARSEVWETTPVPADQPAYLNAAIVAETVLEPRQLLALVEQIERSLGRRPGRRWGPRPADVDILFYGELAMEAKGLTIPHPRLTARVFVLAPLAGMTCQMRGNIGEICSTKNGAAQIANCETAHSSDGTSTSRRVISFPRLPSDGAFDGRTGSRMPTMASIASTAVPAATKKASG